MIRHLIAAFRGVPRAELAADVAGAVSLMILIWAGFVAVGVLG